MATATAPAPKSRTAKPRKTVADPAAGRKTAALKAAALFKMASDGTRVEVLLALAGGEKNVGEMCTLAGQSQPAVSHHLTLMRTSGIVTPRRSGKNNYYSLTPQGEALVAAARTLMGG